MIRFVLRCLGIVLLALAFVFLIYDGVKSIADHGIYATRVEQFWIEVNGASLQALRDNIEREAGAPLWRWVVQPLLNQPAALVFGVLSLILILLGRKKKPMIGYARD
jgi:hypothetical protein